MSDTNATPFETKCDILAQLWIEYKNDPEFADFLEYNDLGMPLSYAISTEIITKSPKAEMLVEETFQLLLAATGHESDEGFESLSDLFNL